MVVVSVVVVVVSFMGVMTVFAWLFRVHMINSLNQQEETRSDGDEETESSDCIVCLCEVSPGDHHHKLPNCNHGVQFHARCIESWLKDHSTCPICRAHVPQPVYRRLKACLSVLWQDVVAYCDSALENVANSIGDCRDF